MKKINSLLLVLFITGGLHALAGDAASSVKDTDGITTQPTAEDTSVVEKEKRTSKPKTNFKDNIFYGGYINLSFGSYMVIGIEPMIGYKLTPKFSAGVKLRYDYIQDDRYAKSYTTSTYGGSIFGRYLVNPKFYAQAEAATYSYEYYFSDEREWVPFVLLGGGYIQPLSERTWLNVEILFDVLQDEKSPYDDWQPFFSIGVGTGF
jgi:hypothetical protein